MSAPARETPPCDPPKTAADLREMFLDQIDRKAMGWRGVEKRKHVRYPHRVDAGVMVGFTAEDGSARAHLVHPRNLSAGGIAFLDEAFIPRGTACTILLRTVAEDTLEVSGRVVDCRAVHGRLHEVAVVFDQAIDVREVLGQDSTDTEAI